MGSNVLQPYTKPPRLLRRISGALGFVGLAFFAFVYGFGYALTTPYLLVGFLVPLLVLSLVVIWALPEARRAPEKTISGLLFAALFVHAVWPNYLAISLPSLPWVTVLRIILAPLAVVFLVAVSTSASFRAKMSTILGPSRSTVWLLTVFMVIQAATIPMSYQPFASLQRTFVNYLYWFLVFFAAAYAFSKPGALKIFFWLLIGLSFFLFAISVAEAAVAKPLWAGHIPPFLKVDDPAVQIILAGNFRSWTGVYRVTGTFSNALLLAEYVAMVLPITIFMGVRSRSFQARAICAASVVCSVATIVLTDARLGIIGLILGVGMSVLLLAVRAYRQQRNSLVSLTTLLAFPAGALVVVASTFFVGRIRAMVWGNSSTEQSSTDARWEMIQLGWPQFLKNPFGYGSGQSGSVVGWVSPGGKGSIDQGYLSLLIDYGAAGLLVFVALLVLHFYNGVKHGVLTRSDSDEAYYLLPIMVSVAVFTTTRSVLSLDYNMTLFFALLGGAAAMLSASIGKRPGSATAEPAASISRIRSAG